MSSRAIFFRCRYCCAIFRVSRLRAWFTEAATCDGCLAELGALARRHAEHNRCRIERAKDPANVETLAKRQGPQSCESFRPSTWFRSNRISPIEETKGDPR